MKIQIKYIFLLFLLGIASKTFSQQTIKGKIVRVSDGDTITETFRVIGYSIETAIADILDN